MVSGASGSGVVEEEFEEEELERWTRLGKRFKFSILRVYFDQFRLLINTLI